MMFFDDFLYFLKIKKIIVEFTKTILWLEAISKITSKFDHAV